MPPRARNVGEMFSLGDGAIKQQSAFFHEGDGSSLKWAHVTQAAELEDRGVTKVVQLLAGPGPAPPQVTNCPYNCRCNQASGSCSHLSFLPGNDFLIPVPSLPSIQGSWQCTRSPVETCRNEVGGPTGSCRKEKAFSVLPERKKRKKKKDCPELGLETLGTRSGSAVNSISQAPSFPVCKTWGKEGIVPLCYL